MDNFTGITCFFQSRVVGYELQKSEWHTTTQIPVAATYCCTNGSGLIIEFRLKNVVEFTEDVKSQLTENAREIADEISFYCAVRVPDPTLSGYTVTKNGVDADVPVARQITVAEYGLSQMSIGASIVRFASNLDAENVRKSLASTPRGLKAHHTRFREAMNAPDAVDRFMALYRLIAGLTGDTTQERVELLIKSIVPDVQEQQSPRARGGMETIYTRLRNEVGHVRAAATPSSTRREIESVLPDFIELVRQSIVMHSH